MRTQRLLKSPVSFHSSPWIQLILNPSLHYLPHHHFLCFLILPNSNANVKCSVVGWYRYTYTAQIIFFLYKKKKSSTTIDKHRQDQILYFKNFVEYGLLPKFMHLFCFNFVIDSLQRRKKIVSDCPI